MSTEMPSWVATKADRKRFLEAVSTETLLDAYRELVGDLLAALAATCPKGQVVNGIAERLAALPEPEAYECGGPWSGVAMDDFARGSNRSARLMRLLNAHFEREARP